MALEPSIPRATQGFDVARVATVAFLETFRQEVAPGDREPLLMVARTSLRTKLAEALADRLTDIVTDAVLTVQKPDEPIDLFMVRCLSPSPYLATYADSAKTVSPKLRLRLTGRETLDPSQMARPLTLLTSGNK